MTLFQTTDDQKVRLYEIAAAMAKHGLSESFIAAAVELASDSEGIYDLMECGALPEMRTTEVKSSRTFRRRSTRLLRSRDGRLLAIMRCALLVFLALPVLLLACGDDGNEADRLGVAAACTTTDDCPEVEFNDDHIQLICLTNFKGGYCGLPDCVSSEDCPLGSTCVLHDDGETYCFRECVDKPECNRHRPVEVEANCSGSFDFNDPADDVGQKACIPPSSGI